MTSRPGWPMVFRALRARRGLVAAVVALSVVEALPTLASGLLIAAALDRGFLVGRGSVGFAYLGLLGLAMIVRALATRQLLPRLGRLVEPVRDEFVTTVVTGTVRGAVAGTARPDGASVARLTSQVESVRLLLSALLRSARQFGVSLAMAMIGLVSLAPPVALVVAVPLAVALALAVPLLRLLGRRQRDLLVADEQVAQAAGRTYAGLRDVAACGAGARVAGELDALVDRSRHAARAAAWISGGNTAVVTLGGRLPVLALLVSAPWLLRHGLTPGVLVGAAAYVVTGVEPALRAMVGMLATWGVPLHTVLSRLGEAHPVPAAVAPAGRTPTGSDLVVERLTFAYGPHAAPVLRELSLDVPAGEHLAVVGPSGIGKSTLADLVAGLIRPDGGTVRLGGVPTTELDPARARRDIALIPQEAYVFTGTFRENLLYPRTDGAGDDEILAALAETGADVLLDRVGGLDGRLGTGGPELSAGERQLVALARALLSPARIVLLDEATCHLDPVAEARAEAAFAGRGRTLVVIAHRISSALRADRILLIDGDATVLGTHEELLAGGGAYANLVGHWTASAKMGVTPLYDDERVVAASDA